VESFEQRRNKYFDKLKSNLEVVEKLTEDENSNNKKIVEILLMPTTEKELEFANLCFDFILNVISLVECMDSQEEKDVDLSNSMTIKLFIDVINALKNENISKKLSENSFCFRRVLYSVFSKFLYRLLV